MKTSIDLNLEVTKEMGIFYKLRAVLTLTLRSLKKWVCLPIKTSIDLNLEVTKEMGIVYKLRQVWTLTLKSLKKWAVIAS